MTLENVRVELGYRYEEDEQKPYGGRDSIPTLTLNIPLPGGMAVYTFDIPEKVKSSMEFAKKLSESKT